MIYGVTGMWGANKLGIIKYRIKNVKIFLIAIIWLFILDVYLADYRSMAMTLGLKDSFAILPHVQNDFYFNKIMLLGGMIFFADIPFMSGEELYVVLKIGKEKWSQINCCFRNGRLCAYKCKCNELLFTLCVNAEYFSD